MELLFLIKLKVTQFENNLFENSKVIEDERVIAKLFNEHFRQHKKNSNGASCINKKHNYNSVKEVEKRIEQVDNSKCYFVSWNDIGK